MQQHNAVLECVPPVALTLNQDNRFEIPSHSTLPPCRSINLSLDEKACCRAGRLRARFTWAVVARLGATVDAA